MSLDAKELRIGNIVEYYMPPQISEWIDVELDVANIVEIYQCNIIEKTSSYRPIPLTEEWLLKLGFDDEFKYGENCSIDFILNNTRVQIAKMTGYGKDRGKHQFKYDDIVIILDNYHIDDEIEKDMAVRVNVKYVHQLQNLYYALTGEELTIKNK